jgi:hypothetical protein
MEVETMDSGDSGLKPFAVLVIILSVLYLTLDIWTSLSSPAYGLTPSELKVEAMAVVLLIFIWSIVMLALALVQTRLLRLGLRLVLTVGTIALFANHVAFSREAAPLKKEFSIVAATACHGLENGEIKCGPAYDKYQKQLADTFAKKGIIRIGRWEVEALSSQGNFEFHRASFYLVDPFAKFIADTAFLSRL